MIWLNALVEIRVMVSVFPRCPPVPNEGIVNLPIIQKTTVKHGYDDHGYNEFMVITNKIYWYFGSQTAF